MLISLKKAVQIANNQFQEHLNLVNGYRQSKEDERRIALAMEYGSKVVDLDLLSNVIIEELTNNGYLNGFDAVEVAKKITEEYQNKFTKRFNKNNLG